jgi:hypothetical protein
MTKITMQQYLTLDNATKCRALKLIMLKKMIIEEAKRSGRKNSKSIKKSICGRSGAY